MRDTFVSRRSGGGGVSDHGGLSGLADDDHTQYTTSAEATTIADTQAAAAITTHNGVADPHTGYLKADATRAIAGVLTPDANGTRDLGLTGTRFKDLYLSGKVHCSEVNNNSQLDLQLNGTSRLRLTSGRLEVIGSSELRANTGSRFGFTDTQSTVGAAGGASALPATPTGYARIRVGGTDNMVIPYYAQA